MRSLINTTRQIAAILSVALIAGCQPDGTNQGAESVKSTTSAAAQETLVLVAGATGRTGKHIVETLLANETNVRVLVRNAEKARDYFGDRVDIAVADVKDADAVATAVAGATAVISAIGSGAPAGPNAPEFVDYGGVKNLVDAAIASDAEHFVLVSSLGATKKDHPLNAAVGNVLIWKHKGEEYLRASDLTYTVVRPGGLTDGPARESALTFDQGDRIERGMIARSDVADICVAALTTPAAENRTFEVVGAEGSGERDWEALFGSLTPDP